LAKQRNWRSTLYFRRFREKHTALSQLHWTNELGRYAIRQALLGRNATDYAIDAMGTPFPRGMLPDTVDQMLNALDLRAGNERLNLLVIYAANLEAYLQDVVRLHVSALGHSTGPEVLTPIGKAIAHPVVNKSTLPTMIEYTGYLLDVNYGIHLDHWKIAYKLRCAAAHNGGVVTARTLKDIPSLKLQEGDRIRLSWQELMNYISSADEIASLTDMAVDVPKLHQMERDRVLKEWSEAKKVPPKKDVWKILNKMGLPAATRKEKDAIEKLYY
jgi:hypothetical protein